jgi:hypothetical protein
MRYTKAWERQGRSFLDRDQSINQVSGLGRGIIQNTILVLGQGGTFIQGGGQLHLEGVVMFFDI